MPIIQKETTVAANSSQNLVLGDQYEFLTFPALLEFALAAAATGTLATVYSGSDLLMQESALPVATVFPSYPDGFYLQDVAAVQDRISVTVRNTTGAGIVVRLIIRITPV